MSLNSTNKYSTSPFLSLRFAFCNSIAFAILIVSTCSFGLNLSKLVSRTEPLLFVHCPCENFCPLQPWSWNVKVPLSCSVNSEEYQMVLLYFHFPFKEFTTCFTTEVGATDSISLLFSFLLHCVKRSNPNGVNVTDVNFNRGPRHG